MAGAEVTNKERSEWHDAIGTMGRINYLFLMCDKYSSSLDAYMWYHILRQLRKELWTDCKKLEREKMNQLIQKIDPLIDSYVNMTFTGNVSIEKTLYDSLDDLELTLREVHDYAGYKTKRADDPRFSR